MDDLIVREAAIKEVEEWAEHGHEVIHWTGIKAILETQPAVDAEPVRRGRWIERHHAYSDEESPIEEWQSAKCSVCGKYHTTPYMYYFTDYNYCPHCGAKMEAEG